jgi:MinD-like ATPase involved in chromosome partitioning or flagellar assembly
VATIVSVHSFRGGTGTSNITANVAAILAQDVRRVGVIDADIQSPGIHVLFGLAGSNVEASLNVEARLQAEVRELRIEIDSARQSTRVAEITGSGYFRDLRARAAELRRSVGHRDGDGHE